MFSQIRAAWRIGILTTTVALSANYVLAADAAPKAAEPEPVEGNVLGKNWNPPKFPAELQTQNVSGKATAEFIVDEKGGVSGIKMIDASDPRFGEALIAAIKGSTFEPAVDAGKPIAQAVRLSWNFDLPYKPSTLAPISALPKKPAVADVITDPEYPAIMSPLQRNGEVLCEIAIGTDGTVTDVKVISATDAEFVVAGLPVFKQWKFKPAMQGDLPVVDRKAAPLTFNFDRTGSNDPRTELEVNGITLTGSNGEKLQPACDIEPQILILPLPVYPRELLKSGTGGEAQVLFTIDSDGRPSGVHLDHASTPACGAALVAAVEASLFKNAFTSGKPVPVDAQIKYVYPVIADKAEADDSEETRLLRLVKRGQSIGSAKGLDGKIKPVYRAPAVYPTTLKKDHLKGEAEIEFVIDPHGRAQIPTVTSATREEFGWAAATAVSEWVFDPPTRNGQPTDVRVRIPVHFDPPAE